MTKMTNLGILERSAQYLAGEYNWEPNENRELNVLKVRRIIEKRGQREGLINGIEVLLQAVLLIFDNGSSNPLAVPYLVGDSIQLPEEMIDGLIRLKRAKKSENSESYKKIKNNYLSY